MTKFYELRSSVPSTKGKAIPSASALKSSSEILLTYQFGDSITTVFKNGFYIYQSGKHHTVWAVDRIKYLIYGEEKVQMQDFEDLEWFWILAEMGEYRIELNQETERQKHEDTLEVEKIDVMYSVNMEDDEDEDEEEIPYEKIEQALSVLTSQQKAIFTALVSYPDKTYQELADEMGITKQQVSKQFLAACRKLGLDHKKIRT